MTLLILHTALLVHAAEHGSLYNALGPMPHTHTAINLEVEYATSPLGVDVVSPLLTWQLIHEERGQHQTSYTVTVRGVATNSIVWNSGVVWSNQTFVTYPDDVGSAIPLISNTDYVWSVVWSDADGAISIPSETASFSTAFLPGKGFDGFSRAEWLTSSGNGSLNLYRAVLPALASRPKRVRVSFNHFVSLNARILLVSSRL